jgi:arylesterase/paraoxonase
MIRIIFIVAGLILVAAVARGAFVVPAAAGWIHSTPEPTDNSACTAIEIAPGTEDVTFDPVSGLVFVSADDRRAAGMSPGNGIWVFEPDAPESLRLVSADAPADFRPHGISLYRDEDVARLFVVSHPASGSQVLIFNIGEDGTLAHVRTVTDPAIFSPNDVAATGPDSFYVTNSSRLGDNPGGVLEALLGLPIVNVVHFDGETAKQVAGGLVYGNGIAMSEDGSRVYAANFIAQRIDVFERDPVTNALHKIDTFRAPFGLDNIELDEAGDLWVAGNTEVFSFLAHQSDPEDRAPSFAVRFDHSTGNWEPVFYSGGELIDSASAITPLPDRFLIGAVFDSHVLSCPR